MGSLMKRQTERLLRRQKRYRRWLALFLCLALLVTSGVFAALRMDGRAMDDEGQGNRKLDCNVKVHEHSEECYDQNGGLICGKADYVIHTHNGDCYDQDGSLVCGLEERKAHEHDEDCYQEREVLLCGNEETSADQYTEEPYAQENGDFTCEQEEHLHSDECYDGQGNLLCVLNEHQHSEECDGSQNMGWDGGDGAAQEPHQHTEECYETQRVLTCEELELHTHDEAACYGADGELICETPVLEEHIHSDECYRQEGTGSEENASVPEEGAQENPDRAKKSKAAARAGSGTDGSIGEELTDDSAYVDEIKVTGIKDGVAPFDNDKPPNAPGNDAGPDNKIVRTFDTVNYDFNVNMKPWDSGKVYSKARVKLEFVLPATEREAVFDQTAMAWMDNTDGYKPVVKTERRIINGQEQDCQVLTCYKLLLPSAGNQSVVPGKFGNNVTINVKAMRNGQTFSPIFSAAMEHSTWDGACQNEGHGIEEKKSCTADPITVTAAPKYNIQVDGDGTYKENFDFSTGNDEAANKGIGSVTGRLMKMGITVQLYNDDSSKGLKGIELPQGDISFDLEVSSRFAINQPKAGSGYVQGQVIDNEELKQKGYTPLLWSCGVNGWIENGQPNDDGRLLYDPLCCSPYAPYFEGGSENSCYQSGRWSASQSGSTIHITIQNYEIDPDKMPVKNGDWGSDRYFSNVGCFSAGGIWVVQPFNKMNSSSQDPNFDVVNEYGQGAFATTVQAKNFQATTIGGATVTEQVLINSSPKTDDDYLTRTLELTLPGSMQNRIRYAGTNTDKGSGIDDTRDGRDYAAVNSEVWIMGGLSYNTRNERDNQLYWGTNLTKFYGSAIELQNEWKPYFTDGAALDGKRWDGDGGVRDQIAIYYAVKPDGKDWSSDYELQHTYEDSLIFYKSLDEIPSDKICVGMLFCFKGPGAIENEGNNPQYSCFYKAKVRNDEKLAGNTYMLASTSRVWTKKMFERAGMNLDQIPDWSNSSTELSSFPGTDHYTSANIEGSTWYTPETYNPDGGIKGEHNSDWSHWGDTLLVIAYKTYITRALQQQDGNGGTKSTFNLDADQRVVDFKLMPRTQYDQIGTFNTDPTTVTIVETLPKYLKYKPGSAYFGGTYSQTSEYGGTKGEITGGVLKEPTSVVDNADGTQTLTWMIPNVTIGEEMPPIYYSADIGDKGNPDADVPAGPAVQLVNKVHISAPGDLRDHTIGNGNYAEEGISVIRGSASSFGKYAKQKLVEEDGEIDYVVYFNNNAENADHVAIMDTMPADKVNGSKFIGTYRLKSWKLDIARCNPDKIKVYYTTEEKYKNKTIEEVKEAPIEKWPQITVSPDGTMAIPKENGKDVTPVAWAVIGTLESGQSIYIDMTIELDPGASASNRPQDDRNYFVNILSSGTTTITTETVTVRRILEGLTWMDHDRNGQQNEPQEDRISGVKVELLKLKANGSPEMENDYEPVCYPGTNTKIELQTGKQISVRAKDDEGAENYEPGRYKFTDLPPGTYAVRFTDGEGEQKITALHATDADCGNDDTNDSDGIPVLDSNNKLTHTWIPDIYMPPVDKMSVALYESKYHDSGFYPDTVVKVQKVDGSGNPLTGAVFTMKDSKGNTVSFTGGAGSYTVFRDNSDPSLKGKYYIESALNRSYVVGFNGTENGTPTVLQKKNGTPGQLFEIYELENGQKAFLNTGSDRFLDWGGAGSSVIHLWEGVKPPINPNQMWTLTGSDSGGWQFVSNSGGKVMDAYRGASVAEGSQIALYANSGSGSLNQKWYISPTDPKEGTETVTDLSVDASGSITINDLAPGDYTLTEIKAPSGYCLLKGPAEFTLNKDGTIAAKGGNSMVEVTGTGSNQVLKIKNTELYSLPSAGGMGIYWYSIGGMLLMMAAALILYKNSGKEVLGR